MYNMQTNLLVATHWGNRDQMQRTINKEGKLTEEEGRKRADEKKPRDSQQLAFDVRSKSMPFGGRKGGGVEEDCFLASVMVLSYQLSNSSLCEMSL